LLHVCADLTVLVLSLLLLGECLLNFGGCHGDLDSIGLLFEHGGRDDDRTRSHVEKPAELATWALRNNPGWPLERVKESMTAGQDNVSVRLNQPIPVFIVYGTALALENGEVHFYNDIYGHDAALSQVLAKGYPYP